MNLWIDGNGAIVWDDDQYTDAQGNLHTRESNKSTISGLSLVTQVTQPVDATLDIIGFTVQNIEGAWTQVWQTRAKTSEELVADIRSQAQAMLNESDNVATRCVKAQVVYPTIWFDRDIALRACVRTGNGPIPDYPRNPDQSIIYPSGT